MNKLKQVPNAHKWTEERVGEHLIAIYKDAFNADTMYLGRALVREGLYPDVWKYWKKIFPNNGNIQETMLQIEAIFEARLFEGALKKEMASWVAIFGLKNNHRWCEKPEPEPEEKQENPMLIELTADTILLVRTGRSDEYKLVDRLGEEPKGGALPPSP